MVLGIIPIVDGLIRGVSTAYGVVRDFLGTIVAVMPTPLKIVLFLFFILFVGGTVSNLIYDTFTDYQCTVIDGTTYVYDITNPRAFEKWERVYFYKLREQDRLGELGLNDSDLQAYAEDLGTTTSFNYVIKYYWNKFTGLFGDSDDEVNEYNMMCYELYDSLTVQQRLNIGLSPLCGLDDVPEPDVILEEVTEYILESDEVFFYPICVSDDKGGYYPKLSFLGFDVFDFWSWFIGLVTVIGLMGYSKWKEILSR